MQPPNTAATSHSGKVPHLRSFLLTTSIKGVPRLTRARHPLYRALWSVFVLSGSAITLYLVTQLFLQYTANGVTIVITEERDTSLIFPTITLCNLNSLANTNMTLADMKAYMETAKEIRMVTAMQDFNEGQLFDPAILFANVAPHHSNASAHQFLVACQWDIQKGGPKVCGTNDIQMFMYQASLGYCFTLTPPTIGGFVVGISAILYLDNMFEFGVPFYKLTRNTPLSLGAILFVHQNQTLPDLSRGAVLLAGRNNRVNIRAQQRIQKPQPYSQCTGRKTLLQAPEYRYTQQTCLDLCYQTEIIKSCHCISSRALYVPTVKGYVGEPLCGVFNKTKLNQIIRHFETEQQCVQQELSELDRCDQHCHAACEEYRYELTTESTAWPHTALRLAFWREYVMNSTYSHRFMTYNDMWPNTNDTPSMRSWKLKQVKNDDLLTSNFLQVMQILSHHSYEVYIRFVALHIKILIWNILISSSVSIPSASRHNGFWFIIHVKFYISLPYPQVQVSLASTIVQRFRDEPSFTAESLIGTLGGTLNLWIGISFVTLFELLELFLLLCCTDKATTKTGKQVNVTVNAQVGVCACVY